MASSISGPLADELDDVGMPNPETLQGVLDALEAMAPGILQRVVSDTGELRRFVNVYVNDDDVRFLDGLATPTPAGVTVSIVPAVAGG